MSFRRTIMQSNFDSVFDPAAAGRPAKLTIRLKVALFPRDPSAPGHAGSAQHPIHLANGMPQAHQGPMADADGNLIACRSWLVPEWNAFKIRFKKIVELGWNNQMILLPPDDTDGGGLSDADYLQLVDNPRLPAHVECALAIELMPVNAGAHAQIEVVHLAHDGLHFRNWMHRISHDSVELTVRHKSQWPGSPLYQFVAAHEAGHWLHDLSAKHFEHIDAAYAQTVPATQRDNVQYGHVLGKRMAMMGSGSLMTEHEAGPWLGRIRRHTNVLFGWTTIHQIHFRQGQVPLSDRQRQLSSPHH